MRTKQIGALVSVAAITLTLAGTAAAQPAKKKAPKPPTMTTVAKTGDAGAPFTLVDSLGTVSELWFRVTSSNLDLITYGRKTTASKKFVTSTLPGVIPNDQSPFIFEPSHGVLEIVAVDNSPNNLVAWRSANDGKSWASMSTTTINNQLVTDGYYLDPTLMVAAPGGLIGDNSIGSIVKVNSALTSVSTVVPTLGSNPRVAASATGTVYQVSWGDVQASVPYQAGSHTGNVTFPACPSNAINPDGDVTIAAGKTSAVVMEVACGHVYSRTIASSGALGKVVSLGHPMTNDDPGVNGNGIQWGAVGASSNGHFTAAWIGSGGDVQVARSTSGSKWSVQKKLAPVAYSSGDSLDTTAGLSTGNPTWFSSMQTPNAANSMAKVIRAIALTDGYTQPKAPSSHGIPHPKRYVMGSLAATATGQAPFKSFRKSRRYTVRLVDTFTERVTVNITDERTISEGQLDVCGGTATPKVTDGHAKTVSVLCPDDGGGTIDKRDLVVVQIISRNGTITVDAKVA